MEIIDIKLQNQLWQIDIIDNQMLSDAKFKLIFCTKQKYLVKPAKYKDSDFNRKPKRVEKTEKGFRLWFELNVVVLPCKVGSWNLQAEYNNQLQILKLSDSLDKDVFRDSLHVLFKIEMRVYVYPIINNSRIFCFEQMQENMMDAVVKTVRIKGYYTEENKLHLHVNIKKSGKIKKLAVFMRDYENNQGTKIAATIDENGWLHADLSSLEAVNGASDACLGIEYWKNGKYYYRCVYGKENEYHRRYGQGMVNLKNQKITLIPYYGSFERLTIHTVSLDEAEYYGALYDAIAVKQLKIRNMSHSDGKLIISFDSEKIRNSSKAVVIFTDRKNKILCSSVIRSQELNSGSVTIEFEDILRYQVNEKKLRRYVIYIKAWEDNNEIYYRFTDDTRNKKGNSLYDKTERYYEPFLIGEAAMEDDGTYHVSALPYLDEDMNCLRVEIAPKESMYQKQQEAVIRNITVNHRKLKLLISFRDHGRYPKSIYLKLRSAVAEKKYDFQFRMYHVFHNQILVKAVLDLDSVEFEQFYWDIAGEWEVDNEAYSMQLTNRHKILSRSLYLRHMEYNLSNGFFAYPYRKKSKEFALYFRKKTPYDSRWFIIKEYLVLFTYYLMKPYWDRKNVWIVYEKYCQMAQDNGYYFFKYCMEKLPPAEKRHIYYVIDKSAPDYEVVRPFGEHVIDFLSFKHMLYLVAASVLISSDTKAHAYAWHSANSVYRNQIYKKRNVFLQHGVMGFKCCHKGLRRGSANPSSLFIVSSEIEAQIIEKYFEYKRSAIAVTGLARWDVLKDKSSRQNREILLMPTWRIWLEEVQKDEFVQSNYFKNYMNFLNMPQLIELLEKYNIVLNFYIHPKFREYMDEFSTSSEQIQLIPFGSEPLNELIMRCSLMITDYSSASWDVYYQGKPVLFYLFDLALYNETQGSYFDMEKDTFGDSTKDSRHLLELLEYYIENDFHEKDIYAKKREELLPYRDDDNSRRTYDIIKKKGW